MPLASRDHFLKSLLVALAAALISPLGAQSIDEELPLPRWEHETPAPPRISEPGSQFNSLLPTDTLLPSPPEQQGLLQSGPRLTDTPPVLMPGYSELGPTDLSLFLHGSILQAVKPAHAPHQPTPVMSLRELPQELLKSLETEPANEYLLDPKGLVTEVAKLDLERLLEFHAKESRIRLYVLVINNDEKLPTNANLDGLAHGALIRQNSCLAVYPLGEPWRARFLMSKAVHQSTTELSLAELAADCIQDAQQAEDEAQQLQRFTVRLSTRLFWLEKGLLAAESKITIAPLQEVLGTVESQTAAGWASLPLWQVVALAASCATALILVLLALRQRLGQRRTTDHSCVWMLPDPDVLPRLGGAFSGGTAAVVSFKR
ncbi:MAG: hypothetical protein ABL974_17475 [Prosthecobacter sp.]